MRVGWLSIGNDNFGSTRIGVTNIHKRLLHWGHYSVILNYNKIWNVDIEADLETTARRIVDEKLECIVFHKVFGPKAQALLKFCKQKKIKTVFANGDWSENPMYGQVDHVVSGSPYIQKVLAEKYKVKRSHYIDDALETSDYPVKEYQGDNSVVNMAWFGNFTKLEYARDFIKSLNLPPEYKLHTISNAPCSYTKLEADYTMGAATGKKWDVDFLVNFLLDEIDIVVSPIDLKSGDIKSHYAKTANRLTLAMSLGIPIVSTPIPTYELIVQNGVNGFLPESKKEWKETLILLKNKSIREKVGKYSTSEIRKKYHIDTIILDWIRMFNWKANV